MYIKETADYVTMLKYYGFKTMRDFMKAHGVYNLLDAKRLLTIMYEEDHAPKQN